MSNPFSTHTSNLFADRGSIDHALAYASDAINRIESSTDRSAVWTALMVLVNTAAKVWPETPAQVPDDVAQVRAALAARADDAQVPAQGAWVDAQAYQRVEHQLGQKIVALDAALAALAGRVAVLEEWMVPVIPPVEVALDKRITDLDARIETLTDQVNAVSERTTEDALDTAIENWCDTYLDDRMESWASDNLDLDDRVETWMENNLDIENEVRSQLRNASINIEF